MTTTLEELRKYVDSILVINNEKLRSYGNLVMSDAFSMANDVLLTAVKGIAEIITLNAYVNIDFRDVYTVMENSGTALMGIGEGEGDNRARQAVEEATTSVLLNDNDISGAKNVLLYFSYGKDHEITMDEMGEVADYISAKTGSTDTNVIWGTGFDESLGEKVKITLIATGFEQSEPTDPKRYELKETPEEPKQVPLNNITEPTIVHPAPGAPAPGLNNVVDRVINVSGDYVPPAIQTVDTPVEPGMPVAQSKPADTPRRNVYNLYDDEVKTETPTRPQEPTDDGIHLVSRESSQTEVAAPATKPAEPVVQQRPDVWHREPAAAPTRQSQTGKLDMMAMDRAERIKAINNLLRNDINGAQKVESMSIAELTGEEIDLGLHSNQTEASDSVIAPDGSVRPNTSLFQLPD